ncbi:hypothetical protein [Rhodococcus qingshengii]|uniref:hypothetical protein n=1 Tax=Rhodococcus qingshengii TaxID=334542 RepID=UPI0024B9EBC8|nr:hypothetical protein [Rhodococcus qingshengii]MDJ0441416.1 hypothetical protein [Rhodococcus qingshengii]
MNKANVSASALVAAFLLVGCGPSDTPALSTRPTASMPPSSQAIPAQQDSGQYGIVVPGVATNPTRMGTDSISFDLPGMSFFEAVQWMQSHLPVDEAIDAMMPCGTKQSPGMHSWYWRGGVDASALSVTVFDAPVTQVGIFGGTDPDGC